LIEFTELKRNQWKDLVELNKKLVQTWFRYSKLNKKEEEARWQDLSSRERFYHGGPWNDYETLKIHLELFTKFGNVLIGVNSSTRDIIAELEYHISENFIHIDWMMVAPEFQNQGIGSVIIRKIEELAQKQDIHELQTEPEKGVQYFYEANGFNDNIPKIIQSSKNGCSTNHPQWNVEMPNINDLIGDASNTLEYSKFLMKTEIKYARIFGKPDPILWREISDGVIAIQRVVSVLNNRVSLLLSSNAPLSLNEIFDGFNTSIKYIPTTESAYVSLSEELIPTWTKYSQIKKLVKYL
jgi:GNAT superfamily N-acetyltransferase